MKLAIGIDLGGTNIVCGLVNEQGVILAKSKQLTLAHEGFEAVIERIANMVGRIKRSVSPDDKLVGIGMGLPGLIDAENGICRFAGNLNWTQAPVAARLRERTNLPVVLDNDVRTYMYGEARAGAGRGYDYMLGITIGTGISAAIITHGQIHRGFKGMAGEFGFFYLDEIPEIHPAGLSGRLETVASASGIARSAQAAVRSGQATVLADWFAKGEEAKISSYDVSRAYDAGDAVAIAIMNRAGTLLGRSLASVVALLSPQVIVVGGGGALAGERLLAPLREELLGKLLPDYQQDLRVVEAEHNDDAGIMGSGLLALHSL